MKNVIKFPAPETVPPTTTASQIVPVGPAEQERGNLVLKAIWVLTVLLWPVLRYVVILDCVYQFFRMLWFWDTPGTYAGFTFMLHFAVLTGLTWFVSVYQPKGL
ncbi:KleE stable inheritance protein [Massilia soli]|uniref:Protein kleE n=1 Tax=Massilia soli TaxID=2792854 RepID=A0ABS7SK32_9BURK|nr:KleE stable inheritance protein [Massilia soli]MBZ2206548.1 protein kleE [Massilia soli]